MILRHFNHLVDPKTQNCISQSSYSELSIEFLITKNSSENFYPLKITFIGEDEKSRNDHMLPSINSSIFSIISLKRIKEKRGIQDVSSR